MLPIDPTADPSRRAWLACPACDHGRDCAVCQDRRNCRDHWQYLLSNQGAVVHLHSTHSVAVSVLADPDPDDVLPPLTAYYVMRVGRLPLVPYHAPGDEALARAVERLAENNHALLLANHGPVVAGATLREAQYAIEELEETAKLFLLLRGERLRPLTPEQAEALRRG